MTFPTHRLQFVADTARVAGKLRELFCVPPTSHPPSDLADRSAEKLCAEMKAHTDPFHFCLCARACVQVYLAVCAQVYLSVRAHMCI